MKTTIVTLFVVGAILASCSSNGNKAETSDAKTIETSKSEGAETYSNIKDGSAIMWRASHLAGVQPRWGKVSLKSAEVSVSDGVISHASVLIDLPTLTVENFGDDKETTAKLTEHLLSADFFKVDSFPTAQFELSSIESVDLDYNSIITGNLTILDVTKSITFKANVTSSATEVSIKSEDFAINRTDWGLSYNTEGTVGVPADYLIANEIGFTIDVSVLK